MWIEATAGSGKSFLLEHFAESLGDDCQVRSATALRGTATPYAIPLALTRTTVRDLVGTGGAKRSFFEAGVANASDVIAVETLVDRTVQAGSSGAVVWIVDDVHLADVGSLLWIEAMEAMEAIPIVLVVAGRPPDPETPFAATASRLRHRVDPVELGPLRDADVAALCAERFGGAPGPHLRGVLAAAGGSALLVTTLLEGLGLGEIGLVEGVADVEPGLAVRMRSQVSGAVKARLESVVGETNLVAVAAALAGSVFQVADVAAVLGKPLHEVIGDVDRMERAGLLHTDAVLRFRHDHYRLAAIDMVSAPVHRGIHAGYARLYIERGESPLRVVDHLVASAATGSEAATWLTGAAEELVRFDPASSLRFADHAIDVGPAPGRRLSMVRARALASIGRTIEAEAALRALLVGAEPPEEMVLRRDLAMVTFQLGRPLDTVEELAWAASLAPDEAARCRLNAESAFAFLLAGDFERARAVSVEHAGAGERLGDLVTVQAADMVGALVALYHLDLSEANRLGERLERMAALPEAAEATVYQPWFAASLVATLQNDAAAARRLNVTGRLRCMAAGYVWMAPAYDALDALLSLQTGELDDCDAAALGALSFGITDSYGAALWCRAFLARTALARGDTASARVQVAAAEALVSPSQAQLGWDHLAIAQARVAVLDDRVDLALDTLAIGMELFAIRSPRVEVALELVRIAVLHGSAERAEAAAADLAESARLAGCDPWSTDAAYAASLAAYDAAGVARTADRYRAQGRLLRAGEALVDAARMADADSDTAAARSWAAAADEVLMPIGAVGLMAPVRHLLRRRRADVPKGLGRLSRSEVSVVQLLAEGLTNAEIADRLFVSRRTVESHVSSAYRKLGTNNRVELARLVAP